MGVTAESRYLELTLIQAERPQVMVDKFQLTFMLLAWLKGLTQASLFNEDNKGDVMKIIKIIKAVL